MDFSQREVLNIVVVGHVDHGKSTLIGRLLYDTHSLPQGTIDKVMRISREKGKPFEYAYLLDAFEEEQKQNITIDTTQIQFQTEQRDYVIIDAPGHKEFLKNMISGAANAEAAFLLIDAAEGVQEQSKRHAYILSLLGIQKCYVIVNKMDLVAYSQQVYDEIVTKMSAFLEELQVHPIGYIPASAREGQNITQSSEQLSWYDGPTVLSAMDSIQKEKGLEHRMLRFPIQDVYKFDNRRIIAGRIESGTLHAGDEITIYPEGKTTRVKTVEYWAERDKKDTISAGESVGITVTDEFFNKRGELIARADTKPLISNAFRANLFWMGKNPLVPGKTYKLKLATAESECRLSRIIKVIDASTLDGGAKQQVDLNDVAEVILTTRDDVAFDAFADCQVTGRFVLVDGYDVAGGGIIAGAEESVRDVTGASFQLPGKRQKVAMFDEFYYDYENLTVSKTEAPNAVYTIGDTIPLEGDSYSYPAYCDILLMKHNGAIAIRNGKVSKITTLDAYEFAGLPCINSRGFEIMVYCPEDLEEFKAANRQAQECAGHGEDISGFLNKWLDFEAFRQIAFTSSK